MTLLLLLSAIAPEEEQHSHPPPAKDPFRVPTTQENKPANTPTAPAQFHDGGKSRFKHKDPGTSSRSMASKTPVGFIGLGNMGSPMAKNLLKHGYPVIATDVFPESCKELQDLGAQILDCPAEVADKADRIITMLPSSPNVIEVYNGPNGILKKVKKGTLLIDSSTIDPSVSKEMAVAAEKMGAVFMDAPVSGGKGNAEG
ncbi:hypothetical protein Z043_101836 [Scleropages formosus]|uniref:3-hydroxyisobutyrate dehydrogenase n=1 Tax=Scleropages formosus TaxID=113540 RepID=A0A0P7VX50_SCLFO|nr:hypothetical protein Z043_101836 [Scleropages formosus]